MTREVDVKTLMVYKVCPICHSDMEREDVVLATNPPQYGYLCPNCKNYETDTNMYPHTKMIPVPGSSIFKH